MEHNNGRKPYLPTHEPLFRQGFVGDLQSKSETEVKELLERQEKLLSNRNFVSKLPDRGAKIQRFVASLRDRLRDFEGEIIVSNSQAPIQVESNSPILEIISTDDVPENNNLDKANETLPTDASALDDDLSIIEKGFSDLAIHEGPHYAVVKKASEKAKPSKFVLNRMKEKKTSDDKVVTSRKAEKETQSVERLDRQSASSKTNPSAKTNIELSAATIRNPKNTSVLISIEESRSLVNKQQAIVKKQQSELAAERILSKYMGGDSSRIVSVLEEPSDHQHSSTDDFDDDNDGNDEEDITLDDEEDLDGVD